jgi:hypothetical protein
VDAANTNPAPADGDAQGVDVEGLVQALEIAQSALRMALEAVRPKKQKST